METILITGGTGLVGKALSRLLQDSGFHCIILTRSLKNRQDTDTLSYALWDVAKKNIDVQAVLRADHIVHLAGAGVVEKKWTEAYRKEILESRTESIGLIIDTLKNNPHKVQTIVSASAIGWYGEDALPGKAFTEDDPADDAFLGETCRLWEAAASAGESMGIRVCKIRIGILLSKDGGAYPAFEKPVRAGFAAILGSGRQMVSWIHIDDVCRIFLYAIKNIELSGSYNAVAPHPVTNEELMLTIAKKIKGKFYVSMYVPAFVLKMMMGSRSIEILKSTTVSSGKIKYAGFIFLYPSLEPAVKALEKK